MSEPKLYRLFMVSLVFCICGLFPEGSRAAQFKVLVVMSYDEIYPWVAEIKEGIDSVLADNCRLQYFYMDTKRNMKSAPAKAKAAYDLYQKFRPDGVIASDDNAQSEFVLPYLKDKVKTPVMFCGVNLEPEKYGYPASNVSGILERLHVRESVTFVQQLTSFVRTFGYIAKSSPSGKAVLKQIQREQDTYPAEFTNFKSPKTYEEAVSMTKELREKCDALFMETMHGITDDKGRRFRDKEIIPILMKAFGKPTVGANMYHVKDGILCAVIKTGQEQGETAAKMLLKAMRGTPVSEIPITRNHKGKRMINVTTLKALGIRPRPNVLINAELVKTSK